jgi:hypothetical protein
MISTPPPSAPPRVPPPPVRTAVDPARRPRPEGPPANCTAAWTLVGVLLVYKAVTIALIYVAASASNTAGFLLLATNWIWLIVLGIFLSVLPFALWFRLLRARSRRAQLRRSEWEVS